MDLRTRADGLASGFQPLLAAAHRLAAAHSLGSHGRRRAGAGEEFWQYRPAMAQDGAHGIDWRRSARSDDHFVRQQEWQTAQSVTFWVDRAQSMQFGSGESTKADRGATLALAASILLSKAGERFALAEMQRPPQTGDLQINRMAISLAEHSEDDYGVPPLRAHAVGSQAVYISDFLGDWDALVQALGRAADAGVRGCLMQILDPLEAEFPFEGRLIFESMTGSTQFQSLRARALQQDYLDRLAARQADLKALARRTGWTYLTHRTDASAQSALMWLYGAIERR